MFTKTLKPAAVITAAAIAFSGALLSATPAVASGLAPQTTVATTQLPDFVQLVEKYGKGVVNISTVREARVVEGADPFGFDERHAEIFRRFGFPFPFGGGPRQEPERRGTGSGFIISADGLILTNHHVVDGADEIKVRLTDNREFTGKVLGSDAKTDIAVVKIDAKDLPYLTMGNSDELKVGEWVAAIGSPFGLDNTVTSGIVSAKSRKLPSDQYVPFIQTDVAVNPGNSGGPLFNMKGEVVGINSQIFSTSGGFMGLSFAIPSNLAMQIKDQLVKNGKVTRGRIGVVIQSVTQDLAESFGMKTPKGAIVSQVEKDGPAAKAGLQEGDIITAVNGRAIDDSVDMPVIIGSMAPGSIAKLSIIRNNKDMTLDVKVEEAPNESASSNASKTAAANKLGVTVRPLNDEEKAKAETEGLLVTESTGAARKAGIREGDIIVNVNGVKIKKTDDLARVLEKNKNLRVLVQRRDGRIFIPVRLK
ncbi:DegQ family serine endoprotease [Sutterella sp. AM11-39]|uniref:DegQ family serine endoprotease n=1 Tax=Sutterella sp. AM11-39 TaxID=2292075 RepID=UPI000E4A0CB5|nr:DegQ family serine endoprotease [Sutterella sp. AM11-39]RHJ32841.1 DegQ family serine endoprotease [Sutterella sp. AM11-39]